MVRSGLDRVAAGELDASLRGRAIALVCNPSSVDAQLRHAVDLCRARANLVALFGPEHGVWGQAQDMVGVGGERDPRTGLPVYSLYGSSTETLSPSPIALRGIDALIYDVQDVGCRYYTFPWTLLLTLRACAHAHIEVIVLDRPNPLGGLAIEGGPIDPGFESFVGLCSIPVRHGLTVGELARWLAPSFAPEAKLTVIPMDGWQRTLMYSDTGLPWVLPSPNMPTLDTAFVYPGLCLLEGTNVSEGRGTTRPFEIFGAPFIDGFELADALTREHLPGVRFRPLCFQPTFQKFAGHSCSGVQLHVTDRASFRPLLTGVAILAALRRLYPKDFRWRTERYEFVSDRLAIDLLAGSSRLRQRIDAGADARDIAREWTAYEDSFRDARRPALLYE